MRRQLFRTTRNFRTWFRTCVCITVLYAPFMYGLWVLCNKGKGSSVSVVGKSDTALDDKVSFERSFLFPKHRLSRRVDTDVMYYDQIDDKTKVKNPELEGQGNVVISDFGNRQNVPQVKDRLNDDNKEIMSGMQKQKQSDSRLSNRVGHQHPNKLLNRLSNRSDQNHARWPDDVGRLVDNTKYEQNRVVKTGPKSNFNPGAKNPVILKDAGTNREKVDTPQQNIKARPKRCAGCFNSDFPYLIDQPGLCRTRGNQTIDVIFLILTSYTGRRRRDALRDTWASVSRNNTSNFRHVFLLGNTYQDKLLQEVREESALYRDVLVSDFVDSYRNLTLKTLMGLRWAVTRCRHARFFLKVDDDVWVNTKRLLTAAEKRESLLQTRIGGMCRHSTVIIRDPNSKWYMSPDYFPYDYPPYCVGLGYVGSLDVAEGVVRVSKDVPFFSLEDVYVGLCLEAAGFGIVAIGGFKHNIPRDTNDTCMPWKVIAAHPVYAATMRLFWNGTCET